MVGFGQTLQNKTITYLGFLLYVYWTLNQRLHEVPTQRKKDTQHLLYLPARKLQMGFVIDTKTTSIGTALKRIPRVQQNTSRSSSFC